MGCYTYRSGFTFDNYVGIAFYGRGGDNDEMSKPFDENSHFYRPKGYDCRNEGNLYYFFSSMSRKQCGKSDFNSIFFSIMTFFVGWTEFQGECQDENSKTFDIWISRRDQDRDWDRYGFIPLDKCKPLCHALKPCVACQCYDKHQAGGMVDPRNNYCKVLTADDADPAVMNGLTLEHSKSALFTSNSYPTKGNIVGGWNRLFRCHVKPLGKTVNSN